LVEARLEDKLFEEHYISDWPRKGEVEFKNVVVKYRENLPPALKGLSLWI
jgi:ABC-type bacteriocin/lantibiotic exporter with double-glycine peptidase domain